MSNVIVWDIETVPDIEGFAAANGHEGKGDDEIRAAMGDKFPTTNSRPIDPVFRADKSFWRFRPERREFAGGRRPDRTLPRSSCLARLLKLRWRGPTLPLRVTLG